MDILNEIQHSISASIRRQEHELATLKELQRKVTFLKMAQFVPVDTAAQMIGKSRRTIQNYVAQGKLTPYTKDGGIKMDNSNIHVFISVEELYELC